MFTSHVYISTIIIPGVPTIIRSDCGTENSSLAACHMTLRHEHGDDYCGVRSFRYGSSTTNTVIIMGIKNTAVLCLYNHRELKVGGGNYENLLLTIGCICSRYFLAIVTMLCTCSYTLNRM